MRSLKAPVSFMRVSIHTMIPFIRVLPTKSLIKISIGVNARSANTVARSAHRESSDHAAYSDAD